MSAAQGEPELLVLPDERSVARAAAERLASALAAGVAARGVAHFATTGGSAPGPIYRELTDPGLASTVPWGSVHVWWSDDRFVPRDHPQSNVQLVDQILVNQAAYAGISGSGRVGSDVDIGLVPGVPIPVANIHPFPCTEAIGAGRGPEWCAARYATDLAELIPAVDGWPAFEAMLLGVGPDGHILSVFPGSEAFDRPELAIAVPAPTHVEPYLPRVTLNPAALDVARTLLVVVLGGAKAGVIGEVFGDDRDDRRWPAQRARRAGATWLLDEAAAAEIPARS
jgi:6-phosphogluconolactonase